jgi:hypothetical protein
MIDFLCSLYQGAFEIPHRKIDFDITPISIKDGIFKGRLFSIEQCKEIIRTSEQFAYANSGWRPEIYTLTNLDLHVLIYVSNQQNQTNDRCYSLG